MKIGILLSGYKEDKLEERRLVEAAERQGHQAEVLKLISCSLRICPDEAKIYYNGQRIDNKFDAIIPRIDSPHIDYGLSILQQFQGLGVCVTDRARTIAIGHNKLETLQFFMKHKVPFPVAGYAHSSSDYDRILSTVGGVPLIAKLLEGTEGIGVFLAENLKQAQNILKTFKQLSAPVIVQEFVEECAGEDIRAFVVENKVIGAVMRHSIDGDFRANVALGGVSEKVTLTKEEKELVLQAAKAIDINIAGVDIVRSNKGPLVIEINSAPDFAGPQCMDEVAGVDVAGAIIDYAVRKKKRQDHTQARTRILKNVA